MRIHREGISILIIFLIFVSLVNLLVLWYVPILLPLTLLGALILMGLSLNFFRHPVRNVPKMDEQLIYAPADGRIVVMEEVEETEFFKDKRLQVSIFMSIYDVHANRSPISGTVVYVKYHRGKYLLARHPKSSIENERNTLVFQNKNGILLVRQIAGAVARRIRCYIKQGDSLAQGQEFGFIKFGSRADLFLPLHTKLNVKLGDQVKAGLDVIGQF
ncbi:MAG: phosphatidylserine decarboxylase family protein [Saprospiraceae bacterium]|nr:phosphatidylserine decarboxylase family protein [Saprospiraceae bacterium]